MIGHEAIPVKKRPILANHLFETVQHEKVIMVGKEERLAAIAPIQAVIKGSWVMNPRFASHDDPSHSTCCSIPYAFILQRIVKKYSNSQERPQWG
jgi:hypothetical protein